MRARRWQELIYIFRTASACGVLLAASGMLLAQGNQKVLAPPEFAEAQATQKAIDGVGPKLVALLADENRPAALRLEAAIWLGRLRYTPAIPTLIRYIKLVNPEAVVSDGPEFPCRDALQMFGDAAVPTLVDAFLEFKGRDQDLEFGLYTAIHRKSRTAARTYAKGLATQNPDPKFHKRVEYFLDQIKPDVPR